MKVFAPKPICLQNKEDDHKALRFGNSLLEGAVIDALDKLSLFEFKKAMIASLIENVNNVLKQYGENAILVSTMFKQAELHGLSFAELEKSGEAIRKERAILNGNMTKVLSSFSEECEGNLPAVGNKFLNSRTTFRI